MHQFNQEHTSQSSFYVFKRNTKLEPNKRNSEDTKIIKINKSKLPFDFFKRSTQRTRAIISPLDFNPINLLSQRNCSPRKVPHTERKINSYQNLPPTEFQPSYEVNLSSTDGLKFDQQTKNQIRRMIFSRQIDTIKDKKCNQSKSIIFEGDNLKKPSKSKEVSHKTKPKQKMFAKTQVLRNCQQTLKKNVIGAKKNNHSLLQISDMGCTFGNGFQRGKNLTFESSKVIQNGYKNDSLQIQEQIERESTDQIIQNSNKKNSEQKSTEQSQIMDALKMQNCTLKNLIKGSSRRMSVEMQSLNYESGLRLNKKQEKTTKIQWIKDINPIEELNLLKSKDIFTSEQKQRRKMHRINNSSSQRRQNYPRKQQKIGLINLPRIDRAVILT